MKKLLTFTILSICSVIAFAQAKVDFQIQLLTPDIIGEATLDQDPFFEWVKNVNNEISKLLKDEKDDKDVLVLITLHKAQEATIEIGALPKLDKLVIQSLYEGISKYKSPKTKYTDYSFSITAKVNNGCNKEMDYYPAIVFPAEKEILRFKALDLAGKKSDLQAWMQNEILPLLAHYETIVDPKFEGVLNIGKMVKQKKYLDTSIENLTEYNPLYWRATMEMNLGNQLIPFTKTCMYIAKGEFDKANRLLFITGFFSEESSLTALLNGEISAKIDLLNKELDEAINAGIALHDKEKYKEAIDHYESLLKIFPRSAWLNYELYFSRIAEMKDPDESEKEWDKSKAIIYSCDPMYHMNVRAKSGQEGYLLFRRQEINNIFQDKENLKADIINYADIGFDLENYGFSAQLYWLILNHFSKDDYGKRNILAYYLYCLDKLGDKESIKNFKGNFPSEFAKIEKERKKAMEESIMYKALKN